LTFKPNEDSILRTKAIRQLFEARTTEAQQHGTDLDGYRRGTAQFLREWCETFGLSWTENGPGFLRDADGRYYKGPGTAHASEVNFRHLAEAIHGHRFVEEYYNPANAFAFDSRRLMEAALDPTAFLNVSVFNQAVVGLLNAEIIEHFAHPHYIGRELVTIKPTTMNGQKLIGTTRIIPTSKEAKGRQPGERHAEIGFSEKYQVTPPTVEDALKIVVTKEAVYFADALQGQVVETAGSVGDELAYGQEKEIADIVMGVVNNYNFMGTNYNTYQTTSPFVNDADNPFEDIADLDAARLRFLNLTDPNTGREIELSGYTILAMPERELSWREKLFAPQLQVATALSGSNFPTRQVLTGNHISQVGGGTYSLVPLTAIWRNRALAGDGLDLTTAQAAQWWWVGDFKKAFWWMENWPLTTWSASPGELEMQDRGLVMVHGANMRGVGYVREPRYVQRNKHS
jgi:hypothetical protein